MGPIIESSLNSTHSLWVADSVKILHVVDGARNQIIAAQNIGPKKICKAAEIGVTNRISAHDSEHLWKIMFGETKVLYMSNDELAGSGP